MLSEILKLFGSAVLVISIFWPSAIFGNPLSQEDRLRIEARIVRSPVGSFDITFIERMRTPDDARPSENEIQEMIQTEFERLEKEGGGFENTGQSREEIRNIIEVQTRRRIDTKHSRRLRKRYLNQGHQSVTMVNRGYYDNIEESKPKQMYDIIVTNVNINAPLKPGVFEWKNYATEDYGVVDYTVDPPLTYSMKEIKDAQSIEGIVEGIEEKAPTVKIAGEAIGRTTSTSSNDVKDEEINIFDEKQSTRSALAVGILSACIFLVIWHGRKFLANGRRSD